MIEIIVGTNRKGSRSLDVARLVLELYKKLGTPAQIMELTEIGLESLTPDHYGSEAKPSKVVNGVSRINRAEGLVIICPEYNGSYPGALKYFIDQWTYPESFEHRPVCFIGLGGRFGGLRPVEHLQQVFGYRNSFIFPDRVFIQNVWSALKDGQLTDGTLQNLLESQAQGFCRFIKALRSENLTEGITR
jgi:NAD(P)H-dependent FMN reductase